MVDLPADDDTEKPAPSRNGRAKRDVYIDKIIEGLRNDVADLQAKLSSGVLTLEDQERTLRIAEITQRINLRNKISVLSVVILIVLALFVLLGLYFVFCKTPIIGGHFVTVRSSYAVALFVAPIASITAITVGLLIGAFRRFKDDDVNSISPLETLELARKIGAQQ